MSFLVWLFKWINSPHCVCGCTSGDHPCHKHERRHLPGHGNGSCAFCRHEKICHLLTGAEA